jgi:hypothetical protein
MELDANAIMMAELAKYSKLQGQMARANSKYYKKTCTLRDDMTPEERLKCEERISKRRATAMKHYNLKKEAQEQC